LKTLVIDPHFAEHIATSLRRDFPGIAVLTARDSAEGCTKAEDCRVVMVLAMHATEALFERAPKLEWIQSFSAGVDKFLAMPQLANLAHLTNAKGIHGPQIGEITILYMISLLRDFPRLIRQQDQKIWDRRPGRKLQGRTVTIWGLGTIGTEVARLAKAFGMKVNAVTRTPRELPFIDTYFSPDQLDKAASESDFLIAAAPATRDNRGRLDAEIFAAMREDGYLINIGRGNLVVELDLIDALQHGTIAGAALDVASTEPMPPENPLWSMPNVILTPHIAGMIEEYPEQIYPIVKTNMAHFLAGDTDQMINRI